MLDGSEDTSWSRTGAKSSPSCFRSGRISELSEDRHGFLCNLSGTGSGPPGANGARFRTVPSASDRLSRIHLPANEKGERERDIVRRAKEQLAQVCAARLRPGFWRRD